MANQVADIHPQTLLLDIAAVCVVVGLSPSTIRRKVADGTFPKPRKRNGRGSPWLWHRDDIERWCRKLESR